MDFIIDEDILLNNLLNIGKIFEIPVGFMCNFHAKAFYMRVFTPITIN